MEDLPSLTDLRLYILVTPKGQQFNFLNPTRKLSDGLFNQHNAQLRAEENPPQYAAAHGKYGTTSLCSKCMAWYVRELLSRTIPFTFPHDHRQVLPIHQRIVYRGPVTLPHSPDLSNFDFFCGEPSKLSCTVESEMDLLARVCSVLQSNKLTVCLTMSGNQCSIDVRHAWRLMVQTPKHLL
ncbi:hypothetical protein CEXT_454221 [Caerostris extrusa]|uniref:Uncharacterized protein n=1 Tax=Caerostris extrusa TaxID=172846 RepID=A0AAV4SEV3_CAEEX|nr:hypothetical protein CEXT_454221 [Caerostris extrusa]